MQAESRGLEYEDTILFLGELNRLDQLFMVLLHIGFKASPGLFQYATNLRNCAPLLSGKDICMLGVGLTFVSLKLKVEWD